MHKVLYDQLAAVEERLWWHEHRRALVRRQLAELSLPPGTAALDVGCGTGGTLDLLGEFASTVVGIDQAEYAVTIARRKHPTADIRQGDANALVETLGEETFDLITYFNVLYHEWIVSERAALEQARRVLRPGGVILLTEPAFPALYRHHDRAGMGSRRFRLPAMRRLLQEAGFAWIDGHYFNAASFLPAWLMARWDRRHRDDDGPVYPLAEITPPPRLLNEGMKSLMACERGVLRLCGMLPFGVSLLCTARRPKELPESKTGHDEG